MRNLCALPGPPRLCHNSTVVSKVYFSCVRLLYGRDESIGCSYRALLPFFFFNFHTRVYLSLIYRPPVLPSPVPVLPPASQVAISQQYLIPKARREHGMDKVRQDYIVKRPTLTSFKEINVVPPCFRRENTLRCHLGARCLHDA